MLAKGAETLPNKVAHDYKALAKLYDAKNYKKGLKNAEKILQSHPDHPETLAMKALFELGLGDQNKAEVNAKMALMKSRMMSMFCWHTYGTILKQKKNFFEAAKCFQQASNFEKDNMQILRQTACLQIQVRDHVNHVATRWKILQQKPNMIYNWAAFAVANHLRGDFEQLYKALSSIDNLRLSIEMKPVQTSHYMIYKAIAYRDGNQFQKMYDELKKNKSLILDQDTWNELMFKCCQKLGKEAQARQCIESLLKKFPENLQYIRKYQKFTGMGGKQVYEQMINNFASKISQIYLLCYIEDPVVFKQKFAELIRPYFQRNLISLFAQIQVIYERSPHEKIIEEVFLEHEASLKDNKYPDGTPSGFPTEYLWALYLLSQHYSRKFSTLKKAYSYICKATEHTNTVSEFYMTKADIEYKMHNNFEALQTINEGRKTDLADRYMNNICVKYLFKCHKPQRAEQMLKLFMRDEASLYELQTQWYIIEAGKAFLKMRQFNPGLRHLNFVDKQFKDMQANQYDFHTYCVRKWTLKEYIEFIAFNDNIYCDKKYAQAAGIAMEHFPEYVHHLMMKQKQNKEEVKQNEDGEGKKKKKKKNKKATNQPEQLPPAEAFRKKIDYNGTQYAEGIKANPMNEAFNYAQNITSARYINKSNIKQNKIYCKAFSNAVRTFIEFNKPLLAIKAHKKLLKTQADPFAEHYWTIKIINYLNKALENEKVADISKEFIKEYLQELADGKSSQEFHSENSQKLPESTLKSIKMNEVQLAVNNKDSRDDFIAFYKKQLSGLMGNNDKSAETLEKVFYLVHKLQFYHEVNSQLKEQLNKIYGEQTTYFTNWVEEIDKLPQSFWSLFWLSPYDQKREEENMKEEEEKKEESKGEQSKKQ